MNSDTATSGSAESGTRPVSSRGSSPASRPVTTNAGADRSPSQTRPPSVRYVRTSVTPGSAAIAATLSGVSVTVGLRGRSARYFTTSASRRRALRSGVNSPRTATFSAGRSSGSAVDSPAWTMTFQKSSRPWNSRSMNARSPSPSDRLNARAQVPTVTPTSVRAVRTFCRHRPPTANRISSPTRIGHHPCCRSCPGSGLYCLVVAQVSDLCSPAQVGDLCHKAEGHTGGRAARGTQTRGPRVAAKRG